MDWRASDVQCRGDVRPAADASRGKDIDVDLTAIVTLDTSGVCRYVVGEAMYSDWELRRVALELLFFDDADESA